MTRKPCHWPLGHKRVSVTARRNSAMCWWVFEVLSP